MKIYFLTYCIALLSYFLLYNNYYISKDYIFDLVKLNFLKILYFWQHSCFVMSRTAKLNSIISASDGKFSIIVLILIKHENSKYSLVGVRKKNILV